MMQKFRAWDKRENNWVDYPIYIDANGDIYWEHYEMGLQEADDLIVMQYTGLKDKRGVQIFEGDVVFDRWANAYTPVFQNGIYMAYNPKNLMQNDPSTQFNIIWKDGCEIIGNIYD